MDKVKLTRQQANALESAKGIGMTPDEIIKFHCSDDLKWALDRESLQEFTGWKLMQALVNGYEVEETPEEQIRKIFKQYDGGLENTIAWEHQQDIIKILNLINIKISGVNEL